MKRFWEGEIPENVFLDTVLETETATPSAEAIHHLKGSLVIQAGMGAHPVLHVQTEALQGLHSQSAPGKMFSDSGWKPGKQSIWEVYVSGAFLF